MCVCKHIYGSYSLVPFMLSIGSAPKLTKTRRILQL